ncbi:MAG: hypothetical protein KGZ49_04325 [Syntrophaceae bacterium]|nr:hypothetical protein [Syntrophaceae bacterium]
MKKPQLYIETSVWNFYFADDAPEKREITLRFFDKVKQDEYEIFISDAVIAEIGRANDEKRQLLLNITKEYNPKRMIINEEVIEPEPKIYYRGGLSGKQGGRRHTRSRCNSL